MKKRILSLLLAFAMTLSMIPVQTFAEDTATACPTCGEINCMTHCQICGSDSCETFHVQCPTCNAYDCTADHTAGATEGATEKPTEGATEGATEQPTQSPVASISELDETPVDNCPYCEETTAEDGTVTHAEGCNAAYVYDGTADVGKYAQLNPEAADYAVFVSDGTDFYNPMVFDSTEFDENLIMVIRNWYWDSATTALWYQVEFYSGGVVEEAAEFWPADAWVLHDYTDTTYDYDPSFEFVTLETPEDTCDVCGKADCDGFHVYCDICAAYNCGKIHLYCNTHDKYDCTETHVWCGTCGKYNCGQTHENVYKPVTAPVIPEKVTKTEGADVSIADELGDAVTEDGFALIEGVKSSLSAWTELEGDVSYQWQVCVNDQWIDIQGQTGKGILLSPAVLLSAMEDADSVSIRCVASTGSETQISQAIPASIASPAATRNLVPSSASAAVETTAEDDDETATKVNLIVNYIFTDGKIAANPWAATLPIDEAYATTTPITVPTIVGYTPAVGEGDNADNATLNGYQLTLDFTAEDLAQDCSINIVYQPAPVKVVVNHHWQNVDDDNYTLHETTETTAVTGTTLGDVDKEYEGFYSLLYEHPTVAADGSTVVDVYYDRYYYLMTFDLGGGYGMDAIYARYGTPITNPGEPTRPGYILTGWTLDGNSAPIMSTMPARNVTYVAVWTPAGEVNYTVVYWSENADDTNYSYWTQVTLQAVPGTLVSGSDSVAPYVSNEQYFTYNDNLTDKDVVIEGDGSTVINVYYNRNYYTIYFYGYGKCALDVHTHGTDCVSELICGANGHTHSAECQRTLICDITEHNHDECAPVCGLPIHTAHTDACLQCDKEIHVEHTVADGCYTLNCSIVPHSHDNCGLQCSHTHTLECYQAEDRYTLKTTTKPTQIDMDDVNEDGVYSYTTGSGGGRRTRYYLYLSGEWYCYYQNSGQQEKSDTTEISLECDHTHDDNCYECGIAANNHTHSLDNGCYNLTCTKPIHAEHTEAEGCYRDVIHAEHTDTCYGHTSHTHTEDCYEYQCGEEPHEHDDSCYRECYKPEHTHTSTCTTNNSNNVIYVITAKYEQNIASVWPTYDLLKTLDEPYTNDDGEVVNAGDSRFRGWDIDGVSSEAVSKRVTMTADLCDTSDGEKNAVAQYSASYFYRLYYMFESFDQTSAADGNERKYYDSNSAGVEGKYYDSSAAFYQEVYYNSDTTFSQKVITGMNPVGTEKTTTGSGNNYVIYNFLYYTRNRWDLKFYNVSQVVKTEADIMYEQPLANYKDDDGNLLSAYKPAYPTDSFEAGTMEFEGWYTTPECYEGTKVDFATLTMPNNDLTLYAKWVPVKRTVRFFLDKADLEAEKTIPEKMAEIYAADHDGAVDANSPYTKFATRTDVSNRSYLLDVTTPGVSEGYEDHPYNGYTFVGWFYLEDGEEKAFDPVNMPVTKDLDLYGKWSSNVLCPYEIRFALDADKDGVADTDSNGNIIFVADSITGSTLAGNSRTFDAKGDTALYAGYQSGYYPNVASHTIDFKAQDSDNDGEQDLNVFTFLYTPSAPVPYSVEYRDKETGERIVVDGETVADKVVSDNTKAVVTENFKPISGYMPDAYQKTLVVVPGGTNVITFWYTKDETHAFYQVNHFVQNLDGKTWTEYRSAAFTGEIGKDYSGTAITIPGFTFSDDLTNTYNTADKINAYTNTALPGTVTFDAASDTVSGTLTENGMELNLYYTRNSCTYKVQYLEYGTNAVLHDEKTETVLYNTYVTEYAVNIEIDLDGDGKYEDFQLYEATENPQSATIKDNTTVLTFYYVRCTQDLTVTKTVTGEGADSSQTFNFTLTSTATDFGGENDAYTYEIDGTKHTITATNKTLSFSLKAGQTIKFLNLPTAKYTVTEQELPLGYYCAEPTKEVTLTKDAEVAVTITNEYAPASLKIKKVVNRVENVADNVTDFVFKIKVPTGVTGSYGYTVGTDSRTATVDAEGKMTITLKDGETAVFANLPTGEYTVAETDYTSKGYSATYVDTDGTTTDGVVTLVKGETDTVTCTNAYPVGSLTISKTVKKAYDADAWSEGTFTFTVTRTDDEVLKVGNVYPVYSGNVKIGDATVDADNKLIVTITVTELNTKTTIKIDNLPKGNYTVTETADDDYEQSAEEITTSISPEDYAGKAEFTNTYTKHLGNLTITKNVDALSGYTAPADAAFTFTVSGAALTKDTYTVSIKNAAGEESKTLNSNVNGGKLTVSLFGGESAVIHDLDLAGYTVVESANDQFVLTASSRASGTILADDTAAATFTNTYVPRGSLKVTKFIDRGQHVNVQINADQAFEFTVTLDYDLDVEEIYTYKVYTKAEDSSTEDTLVETKPLTLTEDKTLTFTLKHNQYIIIENLPAVGYSIEEAPVTGYLAPNFSSETQAIPKDGTAEVTCYNPVELAPGDLQITKTIKDTTPNGIAPRDQAFVFTVRLNYITGTLAESYPIEYTCDNTKGSLSTTADGVATYTMKDGTTLVLATTVAPVEGMDREYTFTLTLYDGLTAKILDLPPCAYSVTESDYSEQGFAASWTGAQNGLLGGARIDDPNPLTALTCTNTYPINNNGKLIIVKQVTKAYARDVLPGDTFTFTVTPTDGNKLEGDYTVKISSVYTDANNVNVADNYNVTATDGKLVIEIPFTADELLMDLNDSRSKQLIIEGLPLGQYDVVEAADEDYNQKPSELKHSVSVGTNPGEATFINNYKRHLGTLTITKTVEGNPPETDTLIFHISGNGVDMDVTITGSGSVTIYDLPLGAYTVTEDTDWSWRYTATTSARSAELILENLHATVSFTNTYNNNKWLNYFTNMLNTFGKSN